jgi:DNA-binding NarL/FixJ family response regulator
MGPTNAQERASTSQTRVIAVDDHAAILSAIAKLLRKSFNVVALASNGVAALDVILRLEPDLVVLDISMPGLSGIEVALELRKRSNKVKIVFLSTHEDSGFVRACLAAGGQGYVTKKFLSSDLIPTIDAVLAGHVFVSRFPSQQDVP